MAAPTIRNTWTGVTPASNADVTVDLTAGGPPLVGNLLVAWVTKDGTDTLTAVTSGWAVVTSNTISGGNCSAYFWKRSIGSETTVTFGGAGGSESFVAIVVEIEGAADPGTLNYVPGVSPTGFSSTGAGTDAALTTPPTHTGISEALMLWGFGFDRNQTPYTLDAAITQLANLNSGGGANDCGGVLGWETFSNFASMPSRVCTQSGSDDWTARALMIYATPDVKVLDWAFQHYTAVNDYNTGTIIGTKNTEVVFTDADLSGGGKDLVFRVGVRLDGPGLHVPTTTSESRWRLQYRHWEGTNTWTAVSSLSSNPIRTAALMSEDNSSNVEQRITDGTSIPYYLPANNRATANGSSGHLIKADGPDFDGLYIIQGTRPSVGVELCKGIRLVKTFTGGELAVGDHIELRLLEERYLDSAGVDFAEPTHVEGHMMIRWGPLVDVQLTGALTQGTATAANGALSVVTIPPSATLSALASVTNANSLVYRYAQANLQSVATATPTGYLPDPPSTFKAKALIQATGVTYNDTPTATLKASTSFARGRPHLSLAHKELLNPVLVSGTVVLDPDRCRNVGPFYDRVNDKYYIVLLDTSDDTAVLHYASSKFGSWTAEPSFKIPLSGGTYSCCQGVGGDDDHLESHIYIANQLDVNDARNVYITEWDGSSFIVQNLQVARSDASIPCTSCAFRKNPNNGRKEIVIAYNGYRSFIDFGIFRGINRVCAAIYDIVDQEITAKNIYLDARWLSPILDFFNPTIVAGRNHENIHIVYMTGPTAWGYAPDTVQDSIWTDTLLPDNSTYYGSNSTSAPWFKGATITPSAQNADLKPIGNAVYYNDSAYPRLRIVCNLNDNYAVLTFNLLCTASTDVISWASGSTAQLTSYLTDTEDATTTANQKMGNYIVVSHPHTTDTYDYPIDMSYPDNAIVLYTSRNLGLGQSVMAGLAQSAGQAAYDNNFGFRGVSTWRGPDHGITDGISASMYKPSDRYIVGMVYNKDGNVMYDEIELSHVEPVEDGFVYYMSADTAIQSQSFTATLTKILNGGSLVMTQAGTIPTWTPTKIARDDIVQATAHLRASGVAYGHATMHWGGSSVLSGHSSILALVGDSYARKWAVSVVSGAAFISTVSDDIEIVPQVDLVVIRGSGDSEGAVSTNPLTATGPAAVSRGRALLDTHSEEYMIVTMDIVYRSGLVLGQIVEVHDRLHDESWRGKIVGIEHRAENVASPRLLTRLEIRKQI